MRREGGVGPYISWDTPVSRGGATGPCRARGRARPLVARGGGDSTLSPVAGATGPLFFQGSCCKFEEKNYTKDLSLYGRATGGIFEIIQNGYIFLKFLFF